jgi:hypothetical protein
MILKEYAEIDENGSDFSKEEERVGIDANLS